MNGIFTAALGIALAAFTASMILLYIVMKKDDTDSIIPPGEPLSPEEARAWLDDLLVKQQEE